MNQFLKEKIRITCDNLKALSERTVQEIRELKYIKSDYKKPQERPVLNDSWADFGREDTVSGKDGHFWFYTKIQTPSTSDAKQLVLQVITGKDGFWDAINPQGLLYLNGEIAQGLDINHTTAYLQPGTEYEVLLYMYIGMIDVEIEVKLNINEIDMAVQKLYYDIKVPYDAAMCFDEEEYNHIKTMKHLEVTCNKIDFRNSFSPEFYKSIEEAEKYIKEEYYEKECGNSDAVVSYIGHTHIDVAWLWTLAQTREKVQRSFATVLALMEKYPEYVFMSSQPQLYEYLKEEEPELYERVKMRIKEGRWEAEGAMWLEADCNLSSGESLIRQIMHGKRFMKEEFDVDSEILWLPDVFGYSAAMPQILKKSGVNKFVTSKISWNETNQLPYDTFMWQGVDGTEIFTYFLTAENHTNKGNYRTYNAMVTPSMHLGTWKHYKQKELNNEVVSTFGYGDGGGGPTIDMLEVEKRLEYGLPGMPKAQMSFAGDFLNRVEERFNKNCELLGRTPKWVGELYLEFHRGTYTSIAKIKKNNRECEFLCQDTETVSVINNLLAAKSYPDKLIYDSWRTILLNQFHDIIPGSSIFEVYEDSDRQYEELRENLGKVKCDGIKSLAENTSEKGIFVYNPNSFEVSDYVQFEDRIIYAENIPSMGYKVIGGEVDIAPVNVFDRHIESEHYSISFDNNMNIISVYDKDNGREVIIPGKTANQLMVYEDYPKEYDNWEITDYYKQKKWEINELSSVTPIKGNGYGGFKIVRPYMNSVITQSIIVYTNSRRIDFETEIDWHEHHVLLKTAFPTTIHTDKATYEIQFGNVERPNHENTSWDRAKFEVCAQKWADISESGYGVSILNNCKYGHSAMGGELSLTLIKCGTYPNAQADQGRHTFTYSLYPHDEDFTKGGTVKEAYKLNRRMTAISADGKGTLNPSFSLISCDCENIIIETVKRAENGKGTIVRLYEAWNKKTTTKLNLGFEAKRIFLCDLMENKIEELGSGNNVKVNVSNFEIVTLFIED